MSKVINMVGGGSSGTPRKYLVKDGVTVNGNLVAKALKASSASGLPAGQPNIAQGTGQVTLGWTSLGTSSLAGAGIVYCDEPVDLSQFTKLFLFGTWNFYCTAGFGQFNLAYNLWTSIGTQYQTDNNLRQTSASGMTAPNGSAFNSACKIDSASILVLDLTTLSSRPSALVGLNFAYSETGYTNVKLYDIWLE